MTGADGDKKAFFISPIGDEGSDIRQRSDVVKRLILESALCPEIVATIERADEHANPGEITPAIIASNPEADLVIVDVTGANPNVFYEMAVAHADGKPCVQFTSGSKMNRCPSTVRTSASSRKRQIVASRLSDSLRQAEFQDYQGNSETESQELRMNRLRAQLAHLDDRMLVLRAEISNVQG